ncbi:MAG: zinc ABC transporter substrate-binding protein [Spirochaetota bacterium]
MKSHSIFYKLLLIIAVTIALTISKNVFAKNFVIVTTYNYIENITRQITGNTATITSLAPPQFDPHFIVPKPSHIVTLRNADLLIINGAQLEAGWLPPLIRQANNPKINTSERGFLDLSGYVKKIEIPQSVTRAKGDVHPDGNPHFHLDPYNIPVLAKAIHQRLILLNPEYAALYTENYTAFITKWQDYLIKWNNALKPLNGKTVITYHTLYNYFLQRYGLTLAATLEPVPGIPPTSKHIKSLEPLFAEKKVAFILQDIYHPDTAAHYFASKYAVPVIVLPHDVNSTSDTKDIFALFDAIVRRLSQ